MAFKKYIVILLALCVTSCYHNKKLIYLQDKRYSKQTTTSIHTTRPQYRIQPHDVLSVKVRGTTDAQISEIFNITPTLGTPYVVPGTLYLEGYSVNESGQIILPVLGALTVSNMTLEEIQALIQQGVNKYLNNATVMVKLVSFKVTVLGEVRNPGYHYVYNNQVTILEALGLAGDLTRYGNRKNIKLIRQHNSTSEVILVDLTDARLLESKYFYLMPNDVLYVEPLRANTERSNLDLLGVLFSAATTTILILNYLDAN